MLPERICKRDRRIRITWKTPLKETITHLLALDVLPALPFIKARSPVLQHIGLGVFLALTLSESSLCPDGGDHVRLQQVHLQVLLQRIRHHVLGAPGSSIIIGFQSETKAEDVEDFIN